MNVLVVHDRPEIGQKIVDILRDCCEGIEVTYCEDGSSARSALSAIFFDLLILDLTLPMVKGGKAAGFVVAEGLLEELFGSSNLMTPGNALGITQDRAALTTVNNNIGPHLMAVIEQTDLTDWEQQLVDRVKYVDQATNSRSASLLSRYDYDVLIMTALDKELRPIKERFDTVRHPLIDGVETFIFSDLQGVVRRGACFAIGRAGQPSASSETQGLLCQLRPQLAIMTGFCGAIPGKANLGDILIAESAIDWDYGKWKPGKVASELYARPEPIVIRNSRVHRLAREIVTYGVRRKQVLAREFELLTNGEIALSEIRMLPFASGSAVIGDVGVVESIQGLNDAIGGVDMESYGFYYACRYAHAAKPEFICIKAVADACGVDKDDRLHVGCSFASAFVAQDIMRRWKYL